jgi:hypothetical protein
MGPSGAFVPGPLVVGRLSRAARTLQRPPFALCGRGLETPRGAGAPPYSETEP